MIKDIMKDPLFLAQKSTDATKADQQVVVDLLDTLRTNLDHCVGMAANIMRKAIPDIWKDTRDYTFLSAPDVYGFHKLNPKGIPVKGIAA